MTEEKSMTWGRGIYRFAAMPGRMFWIGLAAMAAFPLVFGHNEYLMHLVILTLISSVLGMAWNLLGGFTGQVSFGHAAFYGTGAYAGGIIAHRFMVAQGDIDPSQVKELAVQAGHLAWWGLGLGGLTAAALGLLLGWICFRLRGPYFALSMLAASEVLRLIVNNWVGFTNGPRGIDVTRTFTTKEPYFYIVLALAAATFFTIKVLMNSKLGYYFVAIREDQDAAESLGINTTLYKMVSLLVSAFFAGTAGAFYFLYMGYIDTHTVFALHDISVITIMVVMVGGVATYWGPLVGAAIMVLLGEFIRVQAGGLLKKLGEGFSADAIHLAFFGILLILIIIFLPNGVVGDFGKLTRPVRALWARVRPAAEGN